MKWVLTGIYLPEESNKYFLLSTRIYYEKSKDRRQHTCSFKKLGQQYDETGINAYKKAFQNHLVLNEEWACLQFSVHKKYIQVIPFQKSGLVYDKLKFNIVHLKI